MRSAVRSLGDPNVEAVMVLSLNALFGACGEQLRVFYAMDDYLAGAALMRTAPHRLKRLDRQQPRDADLVVAASPALATMYTERGFAPLLVRNGCDVGVLAATDEAAWPDDVHLEGRSQAS